ncbi:TCR/Tet family MFS transporter [Tabrizicola sp. J26]|uniref:TCR/Tet family MFS transporter n=1 Tax=Alitabrizicola rongguiensis TaxID=2909234 RepID=UPI001F3C2D85|nr:TCR/Tet family MFS transporter [Tabrizicola rongguiensis]MCF1709547.1 TCR/Tet family MFS transporter [Tabrizicola rongguiensis]
MSASPASSHAVVFALVTVFLDMVGFGIIMPILPLLIEEVGHMDLAAASIIGGWIFVAFSLAQFAFSPLMGNLSDRYGRRPLLLLAIFGLGLDFLFCALAPNLTWLFVGRVLAGVCGSSYVIANAYIADVTPPEGRARAFGLMGAAFGVGFVLGPAIGGLLGEFGARVPFFVAAGISGINFVYGWFVLPESLTADKRRPFDWRRANPFGALMVFRRYAGVLPLLAVLSVFFFASSVYPAVWAFWGMAKFGWGAATVGLTLAAFGIVTAVFQGVLTGPAVARLGEWRVALIGLVAAVAAAAGYGLVTTLSGVLILLLIHGPEGFVHPMLTAMMSKAVPDNAQGELQGGISAVTNLAMLGGTLTFAQVFGRFMADDSPYRSPDVAYNLAAVLLVVTLGLFLIIVRRPAAKAREA